MLLGLEEAFFCGSEPRTVGGQGQTASQFVSEVSTVTGADGRLVVRLRNQLHVWVPGRPPPLSVGVRRQDPVVVAVQSGGLQQLPGQRLTRSGDPLGLSVVLFGPSDLVQEIRQVLPHWDVVSTRPQVHVEVLVVLRVLLQNQTVAQHQVREPIGCHRTINVHLVLELKEWWEEKRSHPYWMLLVCSSTIVVL